MSGREAGWMIYGAAAVVFGDLKGDGDQGKAGKGEKGAG